MLGGIYWVKVVIFDEYGCRDMKNVKCGHGFAGK